MHSTTKKVLLIVLDGVGAGELPDAARYGDRGCNTLAHVAHAVGGLKLPVLASLGLGNIIPLEGVAPSPAPRASYGRMAEASQGKDSTTGHWELCGLIVSREFPTFPRGFPATLMERFLQETGCNGFLGNITASGTEIIRQLGGEHLRTGQPIVYTSADSVFQIAAHEEVIPLRRLYEICELTRRHVCTDDFAVGRVIARPFIGTPGNFVRTTNRKDFSLPPVGETLLDVLHRVGIETVGIGKIEDLFAFRALSRSTHARTNAEGLRCLVAEAKSPAPALAMANLGDFDTLYGHRNDPARFAGALKEFDEALDAIIGAVPEGGLVFVTADHGNDPTGPGTDHTREYVPLLCLMRGAREGRDLGVRRTFADVGKTIAEYFGVRNSLAGESFLAPVC